MFLKKILNIQYCLIFFSFFALPRAYAENLIGTLMQREGKKEFLIETREGQRIPLVVRPELVKHLSSQTESFIKGITNAKGQKFPRFFNSFTGFWKDESFVISQGPGLHSGSLRLSGVLEKRGGELLIDGQEVIFSSAQKVNRRSFDKSSVDFYLGKNISALGDYNEWGEFIITAAIPTGLYSIKKGVSLYDLNAAKKWGPKDVLGDKTSKKFQSLMSTYFLEKIYRNEISRDGPSFRYTLFEDSSMTSVAPGETALVITLSGRQGDDTAALAGHFASGQATVREDLGLDMEIWNYYDVPNEKLILAGHNNFIDYFGNLTAGQNNYRPTYTMILYGVDPQILQKVRGELDDDYAPLREGSVGFLANYNCTTETVEALKNQEILGRKKIKGPMKRLRNIIGRIVSPIAKVVVPFEEEINALGFSLDNDPSKYIPRSAFESYFKNLDTLIGQLKLKRVDYIFHSQIPSARALGGAPSQSAITIYKGKRTMDKKIKGSANPWPLDEIYHYIEAVMSDED